MIPFLIKDPQSKPSENLQQIIGALTNTDLQFAKRDGRIFVSKQVRLSSGWEA
jgi:flagellar biosynthesis protein FlhG